MKQANVDCAVLPRTHVIVPSIESQYQDVLRSTRLDVRDLLALASRVTAHRDAREILTQSRSTSLDALKRAASRMHDVDLDSAWRAALRGDTQVLDARVLPHVTRRPRRDAGGSPWRTSGWLTRTR